MKIGGYRDDGTLRVLIPGGMTVLLRGDVASPPVDDTEADAFGPWTEPPIALSWQERQQLGKRLDRARTVPLTFFMLQFPFQKKKADGPEVAVEGAPAETAVEAPSAEVPQTSAPAAKSAKPLTKGDLLARINEIAAAKEKEKEGAKDAPPRSTSKRLKLEYEISDREGEEKQPVSEVAQGTQETDESGVPDHLRPMEKRS